MVVPSIANCDWLYLLPGERIGAAPRSASIGVIARYDHTPGSLSGNVRSCSAVRASLIRAVSSSIGAFPPVTWTAASTPPTSSLRVDVAQIAGDQREVRHDEFAEPGRRDAEQYGPSRNCGTV